MLRPPRRWLQCLVFVTQARLRLDHALRIALNAGSLYQQLCTPAGLFCEHPPCTETASGDLEFDATGG